MQMADFTKVKDNPILNIQSEFVNGSDITQSMHKRVILDLSKKIMIRRTPKEDEPGRAESENESFKSIRNIQI